MTTRTYTLPSTAAEREQLVSTLAALTSEFFGYPARAASLAHWRAMPVAELRRVCGNWRGLILKYRRGVASSTDKPLSKEQAR